MIHGSFCSDDPGLSARMVCRNRGRRRAGTGKDQKGENE